MKNDLNKKDKDMRELMEQISKLKGKFIELENEIRSNGVKDRSQKKQDGVKNQINVIPKRKIAGRRVRKRLINSKKTRLRKRGYPRKVVQAKGSRFNMSNDLNAGEIARESLLLVN